MSEFDPKRYWETRLAERGGLEGVGYTALGEQYNRWLYRLRRRVFLRRMRRRGVEFASCDVLDVGSGTGFYPDLWRELGARHVVGSDLTRAAVEAMGRRRPDGEFVQLDITGDLAELGGRQFDVVSAFDILFHIVDDAKYERAIANVGRLVRPGGLFVLSDFFLHHEAERSLHMVSRPLATVERLLRDSGFEVVQRRALSVLMNYPVDSRSGLLRPACWRPRASCGARPCIRWSGCA
jgi:SAM-dependent methyltransferase